MGSHQSSGEAYIIGELQAELARAIADAEDKGHHS